MKFNIKLNFLNLIYLLKQNQTNPVKLLKSDSNRNKRIYYHACTLKLVQKLKMKQRLLHKT